MNKKVVGIVCAIVVVAFLIVGFATNWFKGNAPKDAVTPTTITDTTK